MSARRLLLVVLLLAGCSGDDAGVCGGVCDCVGQKYGPQAHNQCLDTCEHAVLDAPDPRAICVSELESNNLRQCLSSCSAFTSGAASPDARLAPPPSRPDAGVPPPTPDARLPDAPPAPVCGNFVCEAGETTACSDCAARLVLQNHSSYTISYLYVTTCSSTTWGPDRLGEHVVISNDTALLTGLAPGCYDFRATTLDAKHYWERYDQQLTAGKTFTWTLVD